MECGTEIDRELTSALVELGFPPIGTLVNYEGQMFHVMGYSCWVLDVTVDPICDPREYYEIVLYHIGTGICTPFPYLKVEQLAKILQGGEDV